MYLQNIFDYILVCCLSRRINSACDEQLENLVRVSNSFHFDSHRFACARLLFSLIHSCIWCATFAASRETDRQYWRERQRSPLVIRLTCGHISAAMIPPSEVGKLDWLSHYSAITPVCVCVCDNDRTHRMKFHLQPQDVVGRCALQQLGFLISTGQPASSD